MTKPTGEDTSSVLESLLGLLEEVASRPEDAPRRRNELARRIGVHRTTLYRHAVADSAVADLMEHLLAIGNAAAHSAASSSRPGGGRELRHDEFDAQAIQARVESLAAEDVAARVAHLSRQATRANARVVKREFAGDDLPGELALFASDLQIAIRVNQRLLDDLENLIRRWECSVGEQTSKS